MVTLFKTFIFLNYFYLTKIKKKPKCLTTRVVNENVFYMHNIIPLTIRAKRGNVSIGKKNRTQRGHIYLNN